MSATVWAIGSMAEAKLKGGEVMSEHLMTDVGDIRTFALAGNARLTLVSKKSRTRFSYRVRASDDGKVWFVGVLTGSDNESSYTYMGIIRADGSFERGRKSKIGEDAPSMVAWSWWWAWLQRGKLNDGVEVWHEGKCGRCARPLTVPESIARGIGPDCAGIMAA
jgi:hypothetical protein